MALLVAPLHKVTFEGAETEGDGLTVIEKFVVAPLHDIPPPVYIDVTAILPVIGLVPPLVDTKGAIVPVPFPDNPIVGLEFIHVYDVPVPPKGI